jgi:hypothetical protein
VSIMPRQDSQFRKITLFTAAKWTWAFYFLVGQIAFILLIAFSEPVQHLISWRVMLRIYWPAISVMQLIRLNPETTTGQGLAVGIYLLYVSVIGFSIGSIIDMKRKYSQPK